MSQPSKIVLGIDGGGTKTVAWLADATHFDPSRFEEDEGSRLSIIGKGTAGASNCRSVGLQHATTQLEKCIDEAFRNAGLAFQTIDSACLALAGADRRVEQEWIRQWAAEKQVAHRLEVCNDAIPLLYAASLTGPAVAVIAGTGSLAVGRGRAGQIVRCGGWGGRIGDEGSGYRIAVDALQAASRHADHRGPNTRLHTALLEHFAITDFSEIVPIVYDTTFSRGDMAQLASRVFRVADDGDTVAQQIVTKAAADICELITTVAKRIEGFEGRLPIGLAGGVLMHQPRFVETITRMLADAGLHQTETQRIEQPVKGAVRIAALRCNLT